MVYQAVCWNQVRYSVGISADPLYRCDVNFTDVNKIIHGVFSFTPEEKSLYCQCY